MNAALDGHYALVTTHGTSAADDALDAHMHKLFQEEAVSNSGVLKGASRMLRPPTTSGIWRLAGAAVEAVRTGLPVRVIDQGG